MFKALSKNVLHYRASGHGCAEKKQLQETKTEASKFSSGENRNLECNCK
jgi:hypothetical protein